MWTYFLQVIMLQAGFWLFYRIFLKRETFFRWNRFYLLFTSVLSVILPFIKIPVVSQYAMETIHLSPVWIGESSWEENLKLIPESGSTDLLFSIYIAGVVLSTILFFNKLRQIIQKIRRYPHMDYPGYRLVLTDENSEAYSFFHYIFMHKNLYRSPLKDTIIEHERIHIREKHGFDLLFFELMKIIFWFDPFWKLFQNEIKLIHEHIVDTALLQYKKPAEYFSSVMEETFQVSGIQFINPFFNKNQLKQRIMMQQRQTPLRRAKFKLFLFAAFLAMVTFSIQSCNKENFSLNKQNNDGIEITKKELQNIPAENIESITVTINPNKVFILTKDGKKYIYYPENDEMDLRSEIKGSLAKEKIKLENVPFREVDKAPVFPGCEGLGTQETKTCFSAKIAEFIRKHFNKEIAKNLNTNDKILVINTQFIIDENGNVTNILARSRHKPLEEETKRVLRMLPRMEPGQKDGKPVPVRYNLPIKFHIESKK